MLAYLNESSSFISKCQFDFCNCVLVGFAGTPGYLSPEVLRKDPYGKPVDIWACGKATWQTWFVFACELKITYKKSSDPNLLVKTIFGHPFWCFEPFWFKVACKNEL